MRKSYGVLVTVLVLLTACERGSPTSPASRPALAEGAAELAALAPPSFGLVTGPTEINSTGSYTYQFCVTGLENIMGGYSYEFWVNSQLVYTEFHTGDGCAQLVQNVTSSTPDFTVFGRVTSADNPLEIGRTTTLSVKNYTRPITASITGSASVNTGVPCGYSANVSGGHPPYSYVWSADATINGGGTGSPGINVTFDMNGRHEVDLHVTDFVGNTVAVAKSVTSQTSNQLSCTHM